MDDKSRNVIFIAGNNLPLNFFERKLTVAYLKNPPKTFPDGKTMHDDVIQKHAEMEKCLIAYLEENASKVSFTFDAWSSKDLSHYYGLTGHFINKKWHLVSVALDLIFAKKQNTGSFKIEISF